ncbi:lipopolysaccharide biosynthesis protein [Micromonospora zhanjiangensis]
MAVSASRCPAGDGSSWRPGDRSTPGRNPWSAVGGYGTFTLAVNLGALDTVVLGIAGGSAHAGMYGAVSRWTQPVQLLSQSYGAAAAPVIAAAGSAREAVRRTRGSLWLIGVGVAVCALLAAGAGRLVPVLLGEGYRDAAPVLALLSASAAVVLVNQPLVALLQARGYDRLVGRATMTAVLAYLCGVWALAGSWGADGAALASLLAQGALMTTLAFGVAVLLLRPPEVGNRTVPAGTPASPETGQERTSL